MQKEVVSSIESFNKTALESVKRVSEINLKMFERLTEAQIAVASELFEGSVKQVEVVGGAKDLPSALKAQADIATAVNEKLVGHAKKTAEILTEAKDDYAKLVEEGMKVAGDNPFLKPMGKTA